MSVRRLVVALAALVIVASCGSPDREQLAPPASDTASSADTSSEAAVSTSSAVFDALPTAESSAAPPTSSTPPLAEQLGVGGVVPWGAITAEDIERAVQTVANLDLAARAGSVVMVSSPDAIGTTAITDLGLAGVILEGSKGVLVGTAEGGPAEVADLTATLAAQAPAAADGYPVLIGTDQEFGLVQRLVNGFTDIPSQAELGAIADLNEAIQATQQTTAVAGAELAAVGINVDFAPVSDVLPVAGDSAMAGRSFGSDPDRVAALVTAAVAGYQSAGLAATLKHFPGIGELVADTHLSLAALQANCPTWNEIASVPIRAGAEAGVAMVMTGHATFPAVDNSGEPTSLSGVMDQLLRGDQATSVAGCVPIGYTGIRVTDSLLMAPIANGYSSGDAAWRALAAGEDLLLKPVDPAAAIAGIQQAVANGQLAEGRLNEASVRVFALRSALSRMVRPALDTVGSAEHQAVADQAWALVG